MQRVPDRPCLEAFVCLHHVPEARKGCIGAAKSRTFLSHPRVGSRLTCPAENCGGRRRGHETSSNGRRAPRSLAMRRAHERLQASISSDPGPSLDVGNANVRACLGGRSNRQAGRAAESEALRYIIRSSPYMAADSVKAKGSVMRTRHVVGQSGHLRSRSAERVHRRLAHNGGRVLSPSSAAAIRTPRRS